MPKAEIFIEQRNSFKTKSVRYEWLSWSEKESVIYYFHLTKFLVITTSNWSV